MTVRHGSGQTPVYIGAGLLARLGEVADRHLHRRRLVVIADAQVAARIPLSLEAPVLTFPAGEASKTRDTWARLTDELQALGLGRDGALVALGGGVAGDLAGFVAATYHRGVPLLMVPTSLLAMLDSAVGGKTGVDTPAGKNLVGAFHQPVAVVMDPQVLATLPEAELRSGLAEAVKHAALRDAVHFGWLGAAAPAILAKDLRAVEALVRRSVAIKAEIVEADEREHGPRALLNFGHTVAHAIEAASGYRTSHGDAVAIGMVAEARAGEALGLTESGSAAELAALLDMLGLPVRIPAGLATADLMAAMQRDKKNREGVIRMALLQRIGRPARTPQGEWTSPVPEPVIRGALDASR